MAMDQNGFPAMPVQGYKSAAQEAAPGFVQGGSKPFIKPENRTENPENQIENSENRTANPENQTVNPAGQTRKLADDHDSVWHAVFEEGETLKGSFNLLRVGTKLKEINESCFIVEASNQITLDYAVENAANLEALMERHTGRRLRMECCLADGSSRLDQERTAEDLASEIGSKFGIHIDIQ
jgi:hypothetical protein